MKTDIFFQKIRLYTDLTAEAENAWTKILREKEYCKGEYFIDIGQIPKNVAFVCKGLFSQYYITEKGDAVIKYFFPEGRIAGSVPATLTKSESLFAIEAIEHTKVLEYDFHEFKNLVSTYKDVAEFYISYMENHWIVEKEPYEISLRNDTAGVRYDEFISKYPELINRLKKHHIAAFLGITPTQLSRIFFANK
jgi:CRP-like cAMP-binding protein